MSKVSIVIPTYERASCLGRLLSSIEKQTYTDYEVIIIDDCSSTVDEYDRVINEYQGRIKELTFLKNEKNYGTPTHARNIGMRIAKGEYIAFCDDDDEWYPDKLQMQVEMFENSNVRYGLIYTWADTIDEENGKIVFQYRGNVEGKCIKELLKKDFIPTSSVMVRKEELLAAGGMDEQMTYCCEDWDTWVRMLKNGTICGVIRKVLLKYYRRPGECFSMSPQIFNGYIQFYRKHFLYALRTYPFAAMLFLKHLFSIFIKHKLLGVNNRYESNNKD